MPCHGREVLVQLLLEVWREVGRQPDIQKCMDEVALRVRDHLPGSLLLVRRLDPDRSCLETVATSMCRPGVQSPVQRRTECSARQLSDLHEWVRAGRMQRGGAGSAHPALALVRPHDLTGDCIAGPLVGARGVSGALLVAGVPGSLGEAHEALVRTLLEPIAAALANDAAIHELVHRREALEADKRALLSRLDRQDVTDAIVGADGGLRSVMQRVEQVAATDAPVLILGETGTGKEVVARAVHARSRRASAPIVRVNCGAIPPGLVDSELFGHERGSFTGAVATRLGWFERADGGTLFLDEIAELPLDAQVRLLRILQDGTFERVGGQKSLTADVRIVAATHRDLHGMVAAGTFREDLWYRIGIFPIRLPPLRERPEDIPSLAAHFAHRAGVRLGGAPLTPTAGDIAVLISYSWPGNVRELAAVIERAAILGDGHHLRVAASLGIGPSGTRSAASARLEPHAVPDPSLGGAMAGHIERALTASGGRIEGPGGAAARLGVNPHTLRARMRKLGIDWTRFRAPGPPTRVAEPEGHEPPPPALDALESVVRRHIEDALRATSGRIEGVRGAAARLGVNPHTLRARMRKLGIDWGSYRPPRALSEPGR